jgi:serine phosphatase RsbU (regulator of sigma subunit)
LEPGDVIVSATDGITEARRGNSFLGANGLVVLMQSALAFGALDGIGQSLYNGALEFANGRLNDDVCLLLARRREDD